MGTGTSSPRLSGSAGGEIALPLTAVFDTNIQFSATGWRGNPFQCLERARDVEVPMFAVRSIPLVADWPGRGTVVGKAGPLFLHFSLDKVRDL
jgi:hypothetical protein